jgi:predicted ArsR family transcriptional regulator
MTVEDLAGRMHLTANAVRNQLAKLREMNFVVRVGTRRGASKPSVLYAITLEGQIQFSTIYVPVLTQFLRTAEEECSGKELNTFMAATGKALGRRYPKPAGDIGERANAAARLLKTLGGIPQIRSRNGTIIIESLGCPLSALTAENASACRILEGMVTEYVGVKARTCCIRDPVPRCCFQIERDGDQAHRR